MCFDKTKGMKLCPVSFGLAIGIVCGLGAFLAFLYMMVYGGHVGMSTYLTMPDTWGGGMAFTFLALLKGFLFGFFVALFYDIFSCCCPGRCCKKSDQPGSM